MIDLCFRGRQIRRERALVMAIVNRTPDSFYDRGATFDEDAAIVAVRAAVADGADIVDVGGVKAGPGANVDVAEEARRVVPVIAAARAEFPDLIISVDTWRHQVGRLACQAGADLLNDTWAGADSALADVAAEFGAGYVCSHTGGLEPRSRPHRSHYPDVIAAVLAETTRRAEQLAGRGVPERGILIDPTHDFGKNTWHGLELLRRARELTASRWPVLMALSNKDFIGEAIGAGLDDRVEATLAATVVAALAGTSVFRTHHPLETRRVLDVVAAVARRPHLDEAHSGGFSR